MLSHLSRPKILRLFAGTAFVAVSVAAGALIAQQPEPIPPAALVAAPAAVPARSGNRTSRDRTDRDPEAGCISEVTLARLLSPRSTPIRC